MNEQNYSKILCENIIEQRKKLKLTQEALAEKLGITFQAISKWENGLCCPDITLLPKLSEIFVVHIDELFGKKVIVEPHFDLVGDLSWNDDDKLRAIIYKGHKILDNLDDLSNNFTFTYNGEALNVESRCSIICNIVQNQAKAGVNIDCDNINGGAWAGCDVNSDIINGGATAGCDVNSDIISGGASAGYKINCETIEGDVTCNGDVNCSKIDGIVK